MLRLLKSPLRLALHHWGKSIIVVLLLGTSAALYAKPEWRQRAETLAQLVLEWAGFVQHSHDSDDVYWCPMHPQIKRKNANDVCPICNMALVLLEGGGSDSTPGELTLTVRQVQQAGVVSEAVLRRKLYRETDTTGRIAYDERLLTMITSWVRGKSRIEKLHVNYKGIHVHKGDLLAELYSPDLIVAQEEYLIAMQMKADATGLNLRQSMMDASRRKLLDQGATSDQIARLEKAGKVSHTIPVYAPASGTVHMRHVQEGQYVMEGDKLFDLSRMWVFADIFEDEVSQVPLGTKVGITVTSLPDETFEGTVSFVDHMVKAGTRTVPIRVIVDNAAHTLKAGMFARMQFRRDWPGVLAVPENAVMWTGQRAVAIVRQSEGSFQPRELRIGDRWLYDGGGLSAESGGQTDAIAKPSALGSEPSAFSRRRYHAVLAGLRPGEQVVTAGAFLINAEAQFQNVLAKMLPPKDQPATLESALGEPLAGGVRKVLDGYYKLTTSLTEDQLKPIAGQADAMVAASQQLARLASESGAVELQKAATTIAKHATEIGGKGPADLKAARIAYGRISRDMFTLLSENGGQTLFGKDVFAFRCGMAKVGYENWLWWSPEKHNPYMGQKMLSCGTTLDALKP
ncbi:MAG: efflux RND transporter periplasmic adaptor subunit [Planctomycetota bacterium]|nr:efflux RND transporter periplasmic adaptor subunit [Planctomycetota bacterium]